jgi:hypothetical protein
MFNKKGEIATLLTLGLVILGGILAIGSSIFLSKQKTSTNTKAAGDTLECRTSQTEWKCNKDNFTADQNAKNAFCGVYAGLINGSDFGGVINKWKEEYEKNKGYSLGECGGLAGTVQQPPTTNASGGGVVNNGCFSLSADFEVKKEGASDAFYSTITFSKGGHNNIYYNGTAITNGTSLSYGPAWTHPPFPGCGVGCAAGIAKFPNDSGSNRVDFTYLGGIEECNPKTVSLSCAVGVNTNNQTYVSGNGCSCKNCGATSAPITLPTSPSSVGKNTPTPIPTKDKCNEEGGFCDSTKCRYGYIYASQANQYCSSIGEIYCCKNVSTSALTPTAAVVTPIIIGNTCKLKVQVKKDGVGLNGVIISVYKGEMASHPSSEAFESGITESNGNATSIVDDYSAGPVTVFAESKNLDIRQFRVLNPPQSCDALFNFSSSTPSSGLNAPSPTPFCPNPQIPSFKENDIWQIKVMYRDNNGFRIETTDLAPIMNSMINERLREGLLTAKTVNDVRSVLVNAIVKGFEAGIGATVSKIANGVRGVPIAMMLPGGYSFTFPLIEGVIDYTTILSINTNLTGTFGHIFNTVIDYYVNSVITSICP